ncbi:ABC transporter substrate-binding protein [Cutibacterium avidum]|uniref:ABC transporter substrate-binding protein n=1 Tax=Cutibacterium avidum TaxID=33010 RepID=UPI000763CBE4|nr:ABC transporter substrate-binding protein [Cutibacterium avidum]KXA65762.1 ABC transporter, substrate-binding protein, family 3 [Cutibacterium avidum]MCO6632416.1 ABC transporter substrate-binding protein [Cutibacterium avidum]MCO6660861.1 ABC transporter substrate-binding protein [Cutibacterium avidum]MCO6665435.1 ABC transporter substrate-binding protein [Cutibacterium avidum]MCT1416962.1 ABC transporter substrate-binding protein [Cutibacterium avidum]
MKTLRHAAGATLAVVALAVSGCTYASEESETPKADSSKADAASNAQIIDSIKTDPTIAAMVPDDIKKSGALRNGAAANYAPAEFIDTDGSTVVGYDVDYITAVGKLMGLKVTTANAAFPTLIPAIGSKYDVSVSSFTTTPERQKQVTMTTYFKAGFSMAVPKGNPKKVSPDDLCGHSVAVQTGTAQETAAQQKLKECTKAGKKPIDLLSYESQSDATTNVVGGKADVLYADSVITAYAIKQTSQLEALGGITDASKLGVVTAKNDGGLSKAIQAATQKLIDDGTMKKLLASWGTEDGLVKTSQINPES